MFFLFFFLCECGFLLLLRLVGCCCCGRGWGWGGGGGEEGGAGFIVVAKLTISFLSRNGGSQFWQVTLVVTIKPAYLSPTPLCLWQRWARQPRPRRPCRGPARAPSASREWTLPAAASCLRTPVPGHAPRSVHAVSQSVHAVWSVCLSTSQYTLSVSQPVNQ